MLPKWFVCLIMGTINPLTFGEAADLAAGPHGGQGGEHADVAGMALHEPLRFIKC